MSPEEQTLLTSLFERVKTAASTPRDREAEALIEQSVRVQPSAPYYLAQAVIVQEKGLEAAAKHIDELEAQIRQMETDRAQAPPAGGGFLSSIFGSAERPQPHQAPPVAQPSVAPSAGPWGATPRDPQYGAPPVQQPVQQPAYGGPWDRQAQQQQPSAGGSFLRGAMGTAAGVAGGMLLANSLSGLFGNHMSSLGLGGAMPTAAPIEETVVNNYYGDDAVTQASDATPGLEDATPADDGWQQADFDTDSGFDGDFGDDSGTMDV